MGTTGKPARNSAGTARVVSGKIGHRRGMKCAASKRLNNRGTAIASKKENVEAVATVDACDNSNDSGLGFDHHIDFICQRSYVSPTFTDSEYWEEEQVLEKRRRVEIKVESDDANDNFTFPRDNASSSQICIPAPGKIASNRSAITAGGKGGRRNQVGNSNQNVVTSRYGKAQLEILSQPEMQHRARYQTEGSRGAVKDRTGSGFPVVKLSGYDGTATLEVYIGTDQGRVAPHMFYQACKVSGKNSTPCMEQKVNGTVIIQIEFDRSKEMVVTCDCVGILKERNVDVEHRFPEESSTRNKKKSTRCRMVFRTTLTHKTGITETLQATSQPIVCTQPPGVPEICKKSLSACPANGGFELFIFGKNFLKDTHVVFSECESGTEGYWQESVQPDKDFLQQSHLVCVIPPYKKDDVKSGVTVNLQVVSGGKSSEPHSFVYLPIGSSPLQALSTDHNGMNRAISQNFSGSIIFSAPGPLLGVPLVIPQHTITTTTREVETTKNPSQNWTAREIMPPPKVMARPDLRSSSFGALHRFASDAPLPSLSVDTYQSKIGTESETNEAKKDVGPPLCGLLLPAIVTTNRENLAAAPPTNFELAGNPTSAEGQIQQSDHFLSSSSEIIIDPSWTHFSPQIRTNTVAEAPQTDLLLGTVNHFSPTSEVSTGDSAQTALILQLPAAPIGSKASPLITSQFSPEEKSSTQDVPKPQDLILTTNEFPPSSSTTVHPNVANIQGRLILGTVDQFPTSSSCPATVDQADLILEADGQFSTAASGTSAANVPNGTDLMLATVDHFSPTVSSSGTDTPAAQTEMIAAVNHYSPTVPLDGREISVQTVMIETVNQFGSCSNASVPVSQFSNQGPTEESPPQEVFSSPQTMILPIQPQFQPQPSLSISTFVQSSNGEVFPASSTAHHQASQPVIEPLKEAKPIQESFIAPVLEFNSFAPQGAPIEQESSSRDEFHNIVLARDGLKVIGGKTISEVERSKPIPSETKQEGMPHTHDFTQMSDHDLISYINPSCFDQV